MQRQFFSGNTIEQAVMAAARHYGLDPERVAYSLRDKKHGFLRIRRRVVIEVDPEAPEKSEAAPPAPAPASAPKAPPAAPRPERRSAPPAAPRRDDSRGAGRGAATAVPAVAASDGLEEEDAGTAALDHDELRDAVRREFAEEAAADPEVDREVLALEIVLDEILELCDLNVEAVVQRVGDTFEIELEGDDEEEVVLEDGKLLHAIDHLAPRLARGLVDRNLPCRIDCAGFRAAREEELRELAIAAAERVRSEGKPQKLRPMDPAERRVVHLTLADDPDVATESEGSGVMKRVRIFPA